jgi:hypothetical protein
MSTTNIEFKLVGVEQLYAKRMVTFFQNVTDRWKDCFTDVSGKKTPNEFASSVYSEEDIANQQAHIQTLWEITGFEVSALCALVWREYFNKDQKWILTPCAFDIGDSIHPSSLIASSLNINAPQYSLELEPEEDTIYHKWDQIREIEDKLLMEHTDTLIAMLREEITNPESGYNVHK